MHSRPSPGTECSQPAVRGWFLWLPLIVALSLFSFYSYAQQEPNESASLPKGQTLSPVTSWQISEEEVGQVSPDAETVAMFDFEGRIGWVEKSNHKETIWLDGKPASKSYDKVTWVGIHGGHLTFAAKRNGKWVLMRDNEECSAEFDSVIAPQFSSEARLLRVGVCSAKKCYLLQEGTKAGPDFEEISHFTFSGERYAYFGKRDNKYVLVVDGKETGPPMEHYGTVE